MGGVLKDLARLCTAGPEDLSLRLAGGLKDLICLVIGFGLFIPYRLSKLPSWLKLLPLTLREPVSAGALLILRSIVSGLV